MLYLANPCSPDVVNAMTAGRLGLIDTPKQRNAAAGEVLHAADVPWCADNGCFSAKWDQAEWWAFLQRNAHRAHTCLFAVAPDVVGDAAATLAKSAPWFAPIRALGYRVAFVAQNGLEELEVPWAELDVLFLGGSLECLPCAYVYDLPRKPKRREPCPRCGLLLTEWKLGRAAQRLAHEAKQHGKGVHCGRINSAKRYAYAAAPWPVGLGADSADGTYLTFGADTNLPKLLTWGAPTNQLDLFGETA